MTTGSVPILFLLILAGPPAQPIGGDPCEEHVRTLASEATAARHDSARLAVRHCTGDQWARGIGAALWRTQASHDTTELGIAWTEAVALLDSTVYSTALSIASDPTTSKPARLRALVYLIRVGTRLNARSPDQFLGIDPRTGTKGTCRIGRISHAFGTHRESFPDNHRVTIRRMMEDLRDHPDEDTRTIARCGTLLVRE